MFDFNSKPRIFTKSDNIKKQLNKVQDISHLLNQDLLVHVKNTNKKDIYLIEMGKPYINQEDITSFLQGLEEKFSEQRQPMYQLIAKPDGFQEVLTRQLGGPVESSYLPSTFVVNSARLDELSFNMANNGWTPEYVNRIAEEYQKNNSLIQKIY